MSLFINRLQVMSACGKSKKSSTQGVRHWCSYHILTPSVIYYWTDAQQHGIYFVYTINKWNVNSDFIHASVLQLIIDSNKNRNACRIELTLYFLNQKWPTSFFPLIIWINSPLFLLQVAVAIITRSVLTKYQTIARIPGTVLALPWTMSLIRILFRGLHLKLVDGMKRSISSIQIHWQTACHLRRRGEQHGVALLCGQIHRCPVGSKCRIRLPFIRTKNQLSARFARDW